MKRMTVPHAWHAHTKQNRRCKRKTSMQCNASWHAARGRERQELFISSRHSDSYSQSLYIYTMGCNVFKIWERQLSGLIKSTHKRRGRANAQQNDELLVVMRVLDAFSASLTIWESVLELEWGRLLFNLATRCALINIELPLIIGLPLASWVIFLPQLPTIVQRYAWRYRNSWHASWWSCEARDVQPLEVYVVNIGPWTGGCISMPNRVCNSQQNNGNPQSRAK